MFTSSNQLPWEPLSCHGTGEGYFGEKHGRSNCCLLELGSLNSKDERRRTFCHDKVNLLNHGFCILST